VSVAGEGGGSEQLVADGGELGQRFICLDRLRFFEDCSALPPRSGDGWFLGDGRARMCRALMLRQGDGGDRADRLARAGKRSA
jgi:hypothetical protein